MAARHDPLSCPAALRLAINLPASSLAAEKGDRRRRFELLGDTQANVVPKIANAAKVNPRTTASAPVMILSFRVRRAP
jgi:hypothetical protein